MNKNNMNVNASRLVEVPETVLTGLCMKVNELAKMHFELIRLYEVESQLKKQHKAYLHVRDHADTVCAADKKRILSIMQDLVELTTPNEEQPKQESKQLDVFDLPEGMVIMSTDTLGIMQDDMLTLAEVIDHMVSVFRSLMAGNTVTGKDMEALLRAASDTAGDVFARWDEADLTELA